MKGLVWCTALHSVYLCEGFLGLIFGNFIFLTKKIPDFILELKIWILEILLGLGVLDFPSLKIFYASIIKNLTLALRN